MEECYFKESCRLNTSNEGLMGLTGVPLFFDIHLDNLYQNINHEFKHRDSFLIPWGVCLDSLRVFTIS